MNIKLIKEKWIKFYKRGFLTGLIVLSFICLIDQLLQNPFFFNKIDSTNFLLTLSFVFFGSVFCGILSFIFLILLSFITVPKS
jgi:ethanolamine transporter EutH